MEIGRILDYFLQVFGAVTSEKSGNPGRCHFCCQTAQESSTTKLFDRHAVTVSSSLNTHANNTLMI